MFFDLARANDAGRILLNQKELYFWDDEKSVIETKGWVRWVLRERGKIKSRGEGHNVWTNTGREYLSLLVSYQANGSTPGRDDRISYIGVGSGIQTEDPGVTNLVTPLAYSGTNFLAPIDHSSTIFPLTPARTSVRFVRVFAEDEITTAGVDTQVIWELGLFTDGAQSSFARGGRDVTMTAAGVQSPVAYKALPEGIEKTNGLELQIEWEIRF